MSPEAIPPLPAHDTAALDVAFRALSEEVRAATLTTPEAVEDFRLAWLGRKKGRLKALSDAWLKTAPATARKDIGQRFNELKQQIEQQLEAANAAKPHVSAGDAFDITLPGILPLRGAEHPILRTMDEIVTVFARLGFSVATGPEVETDYYNFEALNFPPNHPARDTQDTLVISGQERRIAPSSRQ